MKSQAKHGANLKLVLIVNGLDSGGAEKSTIKLCESFLGDGHEVSLVTISSLFDFYTLKSSISRTDLGADGLRGRRFPKWTGINRLMHWVDSLKKSVKLRRFLLDVNPDCIISMSAKVAVFTYLSTRFLKYPQIGSERIHPDSKIYSHGAMTDTLRPFIYRRHIILSVQTSGVVKWCKDNWAITGFLTPNHLASFPTKQDLGSSTPISLRRDEVLVVSRDHPQKNLDFLLNAWVFVEQLNPKAHLSLVGPENSSRLNGISKTLGLVNFSLQTRTEDLAEFFNGAKLFVSTSRFEGFPNVVLEAISYGLPVVTTPSCDVVDDFGKAGAAVVERSQNPREFAEVIVRALENKDKLSEMSQNALKLSKQYSWEQVGASWYVAIEAAKKEFRST